MKIFDEQISLEPNNFPWTLQVINSIRNNPWTDDEFTFTSDLHDLKVNLGEQKRTAIFRCASGISQIEVAVKSFWLNLGRTLKQPCFIDLGIILASNEVTHGYAYARVIKVFGMQKIYEENLKEGCFSRRVKYLRKYSERAFGDDKKQFLYALCLFTLFVENTSLFSQFYIVNWFSRNENILKDLDNQVNYTLADEALHGQTGTKLILDIKRDYPELFDDELINKIKQEAQESLLAESELVDWMLNGLDEKGLNPPVIKEMLKYRLNESLHDIGVGAIFEIDQEVIKDAEWFINACNMVKMKDFFAGRDTGYTKGDMSITEDDLF